MARLIPLLLASVLLVAACSGSSSTVERSPLPEIDADGAAALLAASQRPVVLNVWASWCVPCRSEAPLLRSAARDFADEIDFVGVAVRDQQGNAAEFIAEFDLDGFEHYFDRTGAVPASLGGVGVPLTFFFDSGGTLVQLHPGVIDERTLALNIDELVRRAG